MEWWTEHDKPLIGMPTGLVSGIDVLDLDQKNGKNGLAVVPDWKTRSPTISCTVSDSRHLYFKSDGTLRSTQNKNGVDIKGRGGYVIVPPSEGYRWLNGSDLSNLPPWPTDLRPASSAATGLSSNRQPLDDWEVDAALKATPSDDYQVWFEVGCALAKKYDDDGFERWDKWSATSEKYDERVCRRKWPECMKVTGYNDGTIVYHANEAQWHRPEQQQATIHATPFGWIDPTTIPQRQWLYRPHYIRKFAGLTAAHSRVGKSAKVIAEILAMASGKSLLGIQPDNKLRVWYWNGEDPFDELQRRIMATVKHYNLTPQDIGDRLFVDSGRIMPIIIAEVDKTGTRLAVPIVDGVIKTIHENRIDVVVIDPFIACHRIPENDNTGIERVAKTWAQIAEATNCAIMLVHHSKKTYGEDVTSADSRGASSLIAAVRAVQILNTMSKREAEELAITELERRRYFRSDFEANMMRPVASVDWYKLELVALGNAVNGQGDEIGVVVRWTPAADVHPRIGAKSIHDIHAALKAGGPWREARSSKVELWAGEALAEALALDLSRKVIQGWIAKALGVLVKAGYLKRVVRRDQNRNLRGYIEAGKAPANDAEILV